MSWHLVSRNVESVVLKFQLFDNTGSGFITFSDLVQLIALTGKVESLKRLRLFFILHLPPLLDTNLETPTSNIQRLIFLSQPVGNANIFHV
jgi:Ca2+-binding EF-hand superfamily protein